ncbi:hypothetical protein J4Q44_G00120250 [Coregonus suidteri]|uniref:Uncharacterized protein n=1 Tax=Coregonus suidteri TaxID=861788 RepID=A0AAN8QU27_9TELE
MQRSLGLNWDLRTNTFTFKVDEDEKPFTRRGVLSTVNSLYDPLGFVAPDTIQGKSILRELTMANNEWDSPLPPEIEEPWVAWRESLKGLCNLHILRAYTKVSPPEARRRDLCIFSDASTKAIAAVAYLKVTDVKGDSHMGFVMDANVRPQVSTLKTTTSPKQLGSLCFSRFSTWKSLTRAITHLIHIARLFNNTTAAKDSNPITYRFGITLRNLNG